MSALFEIEIFCILAKCTSNIICCYLHDTQFYLKKAPRNDSSRCILRSRRSRRGAWFEIPLSSEGSHD